MINHLKYTTKELKEKIKLDKAISQEEKDKEDKKPEVSSDAFALCDLIYDLSRQIRLGRLNG